MCRFLALCASVLTLIAFLATPMPASAGQQNFDDVQIETIAVADGIYMLVGSGGNIGLSVGDDGPFVVDDQYAPLTDKIKAAIAAVSDADVRFVLNTHWHGDHTGGNENFGSSGAMIVAHHNVRKRLNPAEFAEVMGSSDQAAAEALPIVTFTDEVTFYWNEEKIQVFHVANAHTDGDAIVWFTDADVIHMGDNFFAGTYPYIDVDSGGSAQGMIAAVEKVIALAGSGTKIIPGHGPLSSIADLRDFRDMLVTVRDRVQAMINDGLNIDEILTAGPSAEYDDGWGGGFVNPERFVRALYASLAGGS